MVWILGYIFDKVSSDLSLILPNPRALQSVRRKKYTNVQQEGGVGSEAFLIMFKEIT